MRDVLGSGTWLGYCTNVHSGATHAELRANLKKFALEVKAQVCPAEPMGIGLWLSAKAAQQLLEGYATKEFSDWLHQHGLVVFTLNGFPYGDFHTQRVKHGVYRPAWWDEPRLRYTQNLIRILSRLLQFGDESPVLQGSISTLPIGWAAEKTSKAKLAQAAQHLLQIVDHLYALEQQTGRLIHLDLEPEPGCLLDTSQDVVTFFETYLDPLTDPVKIRRYLRVCYDLCHAAVMFEDHAAALARYKAAGIRVGKVQVSSCIELPFAGLSPETQAAAVNQLSTFSEDRYLHQTAVQTADDPGRSLFFEDLPLALDAWRQHRLPIGTWRVHFHVPIFLDHFGLLQTTHTQIENALSLLAEQPDVRHFEVETYAWSVLPDPLRQQDLSQGIARELQWISKLAAKRGQ